MRKLNQLLFLVLTICFSSGSVYSYAQINAAFSANRVEGCAPLVVQFRDESTGGPNSWRWDLGNGTLSFLQNPAGTYFNPGTYTVKLIASNGSQVDSVVKVSYITVYASPVIDFSASDTTGCFPLRVQFTDMSNSGDGIIVSWLWDFGDGDTSAIQNPQHVYLNQGNFNVSLMVKNSKGCIRSITRINYVKINNGVKADFDFSTPASCRPPTPVNFTNKSFGTGVLTYRWEFGDGNSSTSANPSYVYNSAGTYTIKLFVRNNAGCVDSMIQSNALTIGTVSANFDIPSIVCAGKPLIIPNISQPAPSGALWDFGDGTVSDNLSPTKIYANSGNYTIKLVSDFGACKDSVSKPVQVLARPQAKFSAKDTGACKPPLLTSFTQQSLGAVSYKWFFGDGDSSTQADPTHNYTGFGTFDVMLVATNAAGCTDTFLVRNQVKVVPPQVSIIDIPREGCVPFSYQPQLLINSPDSIISYSWDFGDGKTSTLKNPVNIYTTPGTYTVKLYFTTAGGCTDSTIADSAVRVGEKPIVNFVATPREACAFQPIRFNDLSQGPVGDRWFWEFGDGGTSSEKDPSHIYMDTGYFSVKLVVWNNGCKDSLTIPNYIRIKPPIARFIDSSTCDNKFKRWFIDHSIDAHSWFYDFGDGNTSTEKDPVHTYAAAGSYIVKLTVKNDTCEHTSSIQVVIVAEKATFSASDTVICKGTAVSFTSSNLPANVTSYSWNFRNVNTNNRFAGPSNQNIQVYFHEAGQYDVELVITDRFGCRDTLLKPLYIRVYGPTADFESSTNEVCNNSTIQFRDSSKSDGTNPITKWIWNYGDGIIDTLTGPPFQHMYVTAGTYSVQLTVVDERGCAHSFQRSSYITISKPFPGFSSPDTLSCTNKPIRFLNQTTGNGPMTYQWDFGNAIVSGQLQPIVSYSNEGDYNIKLVVTDRFGCIDSIMRPAYIKIRNPKAVFTMSDSVATCPPLVVNFEHQSQNFVSYEWDFGDGTRSKVSAPVHFYTYPGTYKAKLTVVSPGGCIDTMVRTIVVRGPQGDFTYDKLIGCEPTTVRFTGMTKDQVSFVWDFNDGSIVETNDSIISHTYTRMGIYLPKMILVDPQGCRVPIVGKDTIRIYGVNTNFGLSQRIICDSGLVNFRDSTISNDLIIGYRWSFGDGNTSTQRNPSHFYRQSGNYPIELIVTTQTGCVDTGRSVVPIQVVESPIVAVSGDTANCIPATARFNSTVLRNDPASLTWSWTFGNGSTSSLQSPLPVVYGIAGTYPIQLISTNSSGCKDTVLHSFRAHPVPILDAGPDRVICRNNTTDLLAAGAVQYSWTPSTGLSCTNCATPKAAPLENTTYQLHGKNIYGCTATDSVIITVKQPFKISVGKGDTLCVGESMELFANGAEQYLWSPPSGLDNNRVARPKAKPNATVTYQVIGMDNSNCFKDTGYVSVVVYPYPKVSAGDDQTIQVGSSAELKTILSPDVIGIRWMPPTGLSCTSCPNPVAKPRETTTYTVEVVNKGGCISKDEVNLFVFCNNSNVFMPNTFSPNADGNNDVFYPRGKGLFSIKTLRIFNRWGEVVFERTNFEANDATRGWDGTHNGKPAPQDVYVYTIDVMCENKVVLNYKGNVALIR